MTSSQLQAGSSLTRLRSNGDPNCNSLPSKGKPPGFFGRLFRRCGLLSNDLPEGSLSLKACACFGMCSRLLVDKLIG
jgi:hypothetical protein